ncbi:hypothetical protein [Chryseobacterium sp.]|nr:hypothetical protein [Chryseobacterium sp.]
MEYDTFGRLVKALLPLLQQSIEETEGNIEYANNGIKYSNFV